MNSKTKGFVCEGQINMPLIKTIGLDTDVVIHLKNSIPHQQWFYTTQIVKDESVLIHPTVYNQLVGYLYHQTYNKEQTWEFCREEAKEFFKEMKANIFEKSPDDVERAEVIYKKYNPINGIDFEDCLIIAGYERVKASLIYSVTDHFIKTARSIGLYCRRFPSEDAIWKKMKMF